jgi:hypothetical protein
MGALGRFGGDPHDMDRVADHVGGAFLAFWTSGHFDSLMLSGELRKGGVKMRCAMVLAFWALLSVEAVAEIPTIGEGIGLLKCEKFTERYRESTTSTEVLFFNWAQGFMTGRNIPLLTAKQPTRDLSALTGDEQMAKIRTYCDAHPLDFYFVAVVSLFDSLPQKPPKNSN